MKKLCRINHPLPMIVLGAVLVVPAHPQTTTSQAEEQQQPAAGQWSYSLAIAGYLVPNDVSYASPTFSADHTWLHLEARYNYESLQTASLWAGYNFNAGDKVAVSLTPMLGAVFGDTNGMAPGYEFSLSYKKVELTSEGEFVYVPADSHNNFFYSWNELVYSPADWFHAGLVAQRTRVYQTGLDVQRGFSVGVAHKGGDFTVYTFNAGWTDPTIVLNLSWRF